MRPKKPAGAERHRRSAGDLFRARLDQIIDMGHELVRLSKAMRIRHQRQNRRGRKLYSWHAPETECIGKGKAHRPYEFGVKVLIVTTNRRAKGSLTQAQRSQFERIADVLREYLTKGSG